MATFVEVLAPGTGAGNGTAVPSDRSPIVFQVAGAALTSSDTIQIQVQNLGGTWLPTGQSLTATAQRVVVDGPGTFRAARTGTIATSSGAEYAAAPVR